MMASKMKDLHLLMVQYEFLIYIFDTFNQEYLIKFV